MPGWALNIGDHIGTAARPKVVDLRHEGSPETTHVWVTLDSTPDPHRFEADTVFTVWNEE